MCINTLHKGDNDDDDDDDDDNNNNNNNIFNCHPVVVVIMHVHKYEIKIT
jgi:hypothetical protein